MEAPSLSLYLVMICLVLLGVNGERDDRLRFSMPERRHDLFVAENTIACSGMRPGSAPNSRRYSRASAPTISSGSTPPRLRTAERIVAMRIPDAEHITAAGSQNAQNLGIGFALVRKEHHAELAHDGIEASIREGKRHGIGRLEFDLLAGSARAISSIGGLRSVAVRRVAAGNASRNFRVTMPVPAAVSSTRAGSAAATRCAMSAA